NWGFPQGDRSHPHECWPKCGYVVPYYASNVVLPWLPDCVVWLPLPHTGDIACSSCVALLASRRLSQCNRHRNHHQEAFQNIPHWYMMALVAPATRVVVCIHVVPQFHI